MFRQLLLNKNKIATVFDSGAPKSGKEARDTIT
jgi:hypothetical protein